jgi:putative ABC transport system permease protein
MIPRLAARSAWSRRATLGVCVVAIALSTLLLLAVERLRGDARASFVHSVNGVDLVVGARTGAIQLMLHAIFHRGAGSVPMRMDSAQALAAHPAVAWAVPLALGDSHRGHPVLGTTVDYFRYVQHGDATTLRFAAGRPFGAVFEAVIGAEAARRLGYGEGARIVLSHGSALPGHDDHDDDDDHDGHAKHADKPFTVVGVLAPTGTPVDRAVLVSLESLTAIHLDWQGGAPIPGLSIPAEFVAKFDLRPKEVSAVLVGLKQRIDVFRMQREVDRWKSEALIAVMPGLALDELWEVVGVAERVLLAVSVLVIGVGLAGLVAVMLAGLDARRRELAILRAVGAGPRDIFLLLTLEGLLVTALGAMLGVALLAAVTALGAPFLQAHFGILVEARLLSWDEAWLLAGILAAGTLASLAPGVRAYRLSLADGLVPRL